MKFMQFVFEFIMISVKLIIRLVSFLLGLALLIAFAQGTFYRVLTWENIFQILFLELFCIIVFWIMRD